MSVINGEPVAPSPDECVWYVCLTTRGRRQNRRGPMYYNDAMQTVRDWMAQPMTHGFVTATPPAEYPDPNARQRPTFLYDYDEVPAVAGQRDNIRRFRDLPANTTTTAEAPPPAEAERALAAFGEDMRRLRERWDVLLTPPPEPPAIAAEIDRLRWCWDALNPPVATPRVGRPTTDEDEDEDE